MAPSSINELLQSIDRVRHRRSMLLHFRQLGWSLAILLALFMLCALVLMKLPPNSILAMVLFCILAAAMAMLVWLYGRAMRRIKVEDRRLAHYIDERTPGLEQRLLTSLDAWGKGDGGDIHSQLVASLWRDTLSHLEQENLKRTANSRLAWLAASGALAAIGLLTATLWFSEPFSVAARRVAWPWSSGSGDTPGFEAFEVFPGDILIRRGSDVSISAMSKGPRPQNVFLHMRAGTSEWQQVAMQDSDTPKQFSYLLPGIADDLDYYVDGGGLRSSQFRIQVFDLTRVETIDVEYRYPPHTRLETKLQKNNGDVTAPEGTQVRLHVVFDGPVQSAVLRFDNGQGVDLAVADKVAAGEFTIIQDDTYVVDAMDNAGRQIENPVRYLVSAVPDAPPQISVSMPGRDLQVMALEEVRIAVSVTDDFGLSRVLLNYNVGGISEQTVDLFSPAENHESKTLVDADALILLEDLKVSSGDILSYFITAADNNALNGPKQAMSDIYFLEVVNTDEAFRRASGQGGGSAGGMGQGGQGSPPSALVENQKQIIAATWKLLMQQRGTPGETFDGDVGVVTDSQQNLAQRTQMSLNRLSERLSFSDESYDQSVLHLRNAVDHMQSAVDKLTARELEEALGPEQAALQAILKAESQSKMTALQMARNQGGGGGAGESQREREDLQALFDMEMGRLENRYEMPRTASGSLQGEQDDLLQRLRELAQRQERLNRAQVDAQRRKDQMTEAQMRRRLEELRREQEALSRQAQALSQRLSNQQSSRQTRSASSALEQAAQRMQETARNLDQGNPEGAAARGQEALQALRDQENSIRRRNATLDDLVKALGEQASQLRAKEADIIKGLEGARWAEKNQQDRRPRPSAPGGQNNLSPNSEIPDVTEIIAKKDDLKAALNETEELIRAAGARSNTSRPEIARQAKEVLRSLASESIGEQITDSQSDLAAGHLDLATEKEKAIEQAIARLGNRLQGLDPSTPPSDEQQLQAAADAADALARELENMRRAVDALKLQERRSELTRQRGEVPMGENEAAQSDNMDQLRAGLDTGLERSRRYARGLLQPWANGERWAVDARSIQRQLTDAQVEDFMNQPALWHKLLDPVRELAAGLRGQLEITQDGDNTFSPREQAPPSQYESQVENYYQSLSEKE